MVAPSRFTTQNLFGCKAKMIFLTIALVHEVLATYEPSSVPSAALRLLRSQTCDSEPGDEQYSDAGKESTDSPNVIEPGHNESPPIQNTPGDAAYSGVPVNQQSQWQHESESAHSADLQTPCSQPASSCSPPSCSPGSRTIPNEERKEDVTENILEPADIQSVHESPRPSFATPVASLPPPCFSQPSLEAEAEPVDDQKSEERSLYARISEKLRMKQLKPIGAGSYGEVYELPFAEDDISCLKKMMFHCSPDKNLQIVEKDIKRLLREIWLLMYMKHENTLSLKALPIPASKDMLRLWENGIFVVTDLMGGSLIDILKKESLTDTQIKEYAYQILLGLDYIHKGGIMHRDLKPHNILFQTKQNGERVLKIADFGLARYWDPEKNLETKSEVPQSDRKCQGAKRAGRSRTLSYNVQTLFWRAPEVMDYWTETLGRGGREGIAPMYTNKCDIWSVGCIIAEMLLARTEPDKRQKNYHTPYFLSHRWGGGSACENRKLRQYIDHNIWGGEENQKRREKDLRILCEIRMQENGDIIQHIGDDLLTLLAKMMDPNPKDRISAEEALKDPYFAELRKSRESRSEYPILEEEQFKSMEEWIATVEAEANDRFFKDPRSKKQLGTHRYKNGSAVVFDPWSKDDGKFNRIHCTHTRIVYHALQKYKEKISKADELAVVIC